MSAARKARFSLLIVAAITLIVSFALVNCGGGGGESFPGALNSDGAAWTWMSGSKTASQPGVYGTKGMASSTNVPGARDSAMTWIDGSGKLWLFGGFGYDSTGIYGELNDLWKYDPASGTWTWMSGANIKDQKGVYGTIGVTDPSNIPGARDSAVTWIDRSGNLWLFGGFGYDSAGYAGRLNDLWKYDPSSGNWTWVSGDVLNPQGVYGTKGVADPANIPGARAGAVSWIDGSGKLWLFGGWGFDSTGGDGYLNDLWNYDTSSGNWTWVSGARTIDQKGVYGTKGVAASSNQPGSHSYLSSWIDGSGNLWLFGGHGFDSAGSEGELNDLWKYDPSSDQWTWMSGANTVNQSGIYGTKSMAASSNTPGARETAATWIDGSGALWLFGGWSFDSTGYGVGDINDLWKYNPSSGNWTWMGGANICIQIGFYGTKGVAASASIPGARQGAVTWSDGTGRMWLFGGNGVDSNGTGGNLNDLWRYHP